MFPQMLLQEFKLASATNRTFSGQNINEEKGRMESGVILESG